MSAVSNFELSLVVCLNYGVLQGSDLGPVLFRILINGIRHVIDYCKLLLMHMILKYM